MTKRLGRLLLELLVSVDQLVQVILVGLFYLAGLTGCPSADETISSVVGRHAVAGARWALVAERLIDGLFILLGSAPGHCRRHIEPDATR